MLLLLHWSSLKFNRFISCLRFGAESTNAGFVFNKKKNKFSFTDSLNKLSESESKQDSHYIPHSFAFDFIKYKYHKSDGTLVCGFNVNNVVMSLLVGKIDFSFWGTVERIINELVSCVVK